MGNQLRILESRIYLAEILNELLIIFDIKIACNSRDNIDKMNINKS